MNCPHCNATLDVRDILHRAAQERGRKGGLKRKGKPGLSPEKAREVALRRWSKHKLAWHKCEFCSAIFNSAGQIETGSIVAGITKAGICPRCSASKTSA